MISVDNLVKSFSSNGAVVRALDGVSLGVRAGAVVGIAGPSGAGKSTLARCLALQERPDSGAIQFDGIDLLSLDGTGLRAVRRQIGVVPAVKALVPHRTAAGNVALPLEGIGLDGPLRRKRVGELLDLVGLMDKAATHLGELTPGQRRRIAMARALATKPTVLVVDEPTADLDRDAAGAVLTVLDRIRAELGVTVLATTKDTAVLRRICDDVAVLDNGRIVEHGRLLDLVTAESRTAATLLPAVDRGSVTVTGHDRVADVVLVGFAAVGALLPEASARFGVDIAVLAGGLTRLGETPVARFRLGVTGALTDSALGWIAEAGGVVRHVPTGPHQGGELGVAA
ncbi:MAG: ATP-binding cassette domain-containing protein [Kutzneria sp.]|nr:ATP-binding cassette domain-containing protein [Kutzneria sp.]MBV9846831.1 ATP-binding cassette domain-containing protein [Kutzneria sp.]